MSSPEQEEASSNAPARPHYLPLHLAREFYVDEQGRTWISGKPVPESDNVVEVPRATRLVTADAVAALRLATQPPDQIANE